MSDQPVAFDHEVNALRELADTTLRAVVPARRRAEQQGARAFVECVSTMILENMAYIGTEIAVLAGRGPNDRSACAALTALGRLPSEGLIYLAYLHHDAGTDSSWDPNWETSLYYVGSVAWKECYNRCGDWPRTHKHAKESTRPSPWRRLHPLPVSLEETRALDRCEIKYIERGLRELQHSASCGADSELLNAVAPATADAPVEDWRAAWNKVGCKLGEARTRQTWERLAGRWNRLCQWPAGLKPKYALDESELVATIAKLTSAELSTSEDRDANVEEFRGWLSSHGLDLMNSLVHMGPVRTSHDPAVYAGIVIVNAMYCLWFAARILPSAYNWANPMRNWKIGTEARTM